MDQLCSMKETNGCQCVHQLCAQNTLLKTAFSLVQYKIPGLKRDEFGICVYPT